MDLQTGLSLVIVMVIFSVWVRLMFYSGQQGCQACPNANSKQAPDSQRELITLQDSPV